MDSTDHTTAIHKTQSDVHGVTSLYPIFAPSTSFPPTWPRSLCDNLGFMVPALHDVKGRVYALREFALWVPKERCAYSSSACGEDAMAYHNEC